MEEAGGRECEESLVEDQGSCKSNEMEGRCESEHERDEVYPATFGDQEKNGLKLDGSMINLINQLDTVDTLGVILAQKSKKKCFQNECLVRSSLWQPPAQRSHNVGLSGVRCT